MELITSTDVVRNLCKKMAPPLVTLLSSEPEIQYVALRNINLIVQRRPTILAHEIKVNWYNPAYLIEMCILTCIWKMPVCTSCWLCCDQGGACLSKTFLLLLGVFLQVQ